MVAINLYIIYLFFLIHGASSKKSFTLVLDTTNSMRDEVDIIKENLHTALDVENMDLEYILLPFGDPDVGPPIKSTSAGRFLSLLELVEVIEGNDCPEKSLSGVEMALQNSLPNSFIFLFTDGLAKDADKIGAVETLCRQQQSKVFIFLTGKCESGDSFEVFHDLARVCSGTFYYFELSALRRSFTYIKEIMKVDWTGVPRREEFYENTQVTLNVDRYVSEVLVGISGEYPELQIQENFEIINIEQIMKTKHAYVVRIIQPVLGDYILEAHSQGNALITILTHQDLQFEYGFSPKEPRSLNETSDRPIPGSNSHILFLLPHPSFLDLTSVEVHLIKTGERKTLAIDVRDANNGFYIAQHLFETGNAFKLYVTGRIGPDKYITGVTKILEPQKMVMVTKWTNPRVEILDSDMTLVDFATRASFACKIESFPAPSVSWEDNEGLIPSETFLLQIPSTYLSYARIDNATQNGTLTCTAKNTLGESSVSIDVFVNRTFTFEVIQDLSDITVEYGREGKLYFEIEAYPEVEVKWYHNGSEIISNDEVELVENDHMLIIKEMDLHHVGEYVCEVKNDVEFERLSATVYITGLDPPEVNLQTTEIVLKPGDWTEQKCTVVKGTPEPSISWKYKLGDTSEYSDIPKGIYIEGDIMKIPSAQTNHAGVYTCEAANLVGIDSQEVSVKIQYPPKIRNKDEQIMVKQGDLVELPCDVDAVPYAEVSWDIYQNNVIVDFDSSHYTDASYKHKFIAKHNDSGIYHCTAQNSMGKAIRTVNVNVWVAPYIEPPITKNITLTKGSSITLDCYISYGNPVPSSRWEFISVNTHISVLKTGNLKGNLNYNLKNITKGQKGTYRCVSENDIGVDTISIYLDVI